jgi:hypothetical protein
MCKMSSGQKIQASQRANSVLACKTERDHVLILH